MTLPIRKFGIEIEFIGVYPSDLHRAINDLGIPCEVEGYNHNVRNHWKITTDSSIQINSGMEHGQCGELVSPPLFGVNGLEQVRKVITALAEIGGTVNKTCGFHVHVDANNLNPSQILNVVRRYGNYENEINAFMPPSRRNSRWAYSVAGTYTDSIVSAVERNTGNLRAVASGLDRYRTVNLAAYARHGTIEFRQHSGTANPDKVANWVQFCLYFVERSILGFDVVTPVDNNMVSAPVVRTRGRQPNFVARRALIQTFMNDGGTRQAAAASGYSAQSVRSNHLQAIRTFAHTGGISYYNSNWFRITNQELANQWLGLAPGSVINSQNPVACRLPATLENENLYADMPSHIEAYYRQRTLEFTR
jgi:hypothetical protein